MSIDWKKGTKAIIEDLGKADKKNKSEKDKLFSSELNLGFDKIKPIGKKEMAEDWLNPKRCLKEDKMMAGVWGERKCTCTKCSKKK
jgi:hypothetical protein